MSITLEEFKKNPEAVFGLAEKSKIAVVSDGKIIGYVFGPTAIRWMAAKDFIGSYDGDVGADKNYDSIREKKAEDCEKGL